jgi:hypothetical protein
MRLAPAFVLLLLAGLPAWAEDAPAKPADGEHAAEAPAEGEEPVDPGYIPVALNVAGVDYAIEVTPQDFAPADLRLRRADGATMADQGYVVAELALSACAEAGLDYDPGVPPMLGSDGSWTIKGGCR